jgi:circadian clock protein KaiC
LDSIEIIELLPDEEDLRRDEQLTMLPSSEVELGETTRKVLEAIERSSPTRMVLDSLSELRLLAQSSLRYRRQILALKQFFVGRRCTVLLLNDRTAEGSQLQLHSIAHGVISLNSSSPAYGQSRRELQIIKFRGSQFISGFHDFTIHRGGITVYPRLVASEHTSTYGAEMLPSGVTALDKLMGGGIDRGTSTLLIGPPGSGKSTIALQYAAAAAARGDQIRAALAICRDRDPNPRRLRARPDRDPTGRSRGHLPGRVCACGARQRRAREGPGNHHRQPQRLFERHAAR